MNGDESLTTCLSKILDAKLVLQTEVCALFGVKLTIDGPYFPPIDNTQQMNDSLQGEIPGASVRKTQETTIDENAADAPTYSIISENQDETENINPRVEPHRSVLKSGGKIEREHPEVFYFLVFKKLQYLFLTSSFLHDQRSKIDLVL